MDSVGLTRISTIIFVIGWVNPEAPIRWIEPLLTLRRALRLHQPASKASASVRAPTTANSQPRKGIRVFSGIRRDSRGPN